MRSIKESQIYIYIQERKRAQIDYLIIYLFPICSALLASVFTTSYLTTIVLFYGIPSLYLSMRYTRSIRRAGIFALIMGTVLTIPLDYLAHLNGAWEIIAPGYRILNFIPLVDFVWAFLIVYLIIMHHEGLAHHHYKHKVDSQRSRLFINSMVSVFILFFIVYFRFHEYMRIEYFYLKAGTLSLIIPTSIWLYRKVKRILIFLKTALFFGLTSMLHEIVALNNHHWIFPKFGSFIGYIPFFNHRIPIEEYLFFFILMSVGILTYYEFFEESGRSG